MKKLSDNDRQVLEDLSLEIMYQMNNFDVEGEDTKSFMRFLYSRIQERLDGKDEEGV